MPFWCPEFFIRLARPLVGTRLSNASKRKPILLCTGLAFYTWWEYRRLPLLPTLALADWLIARRIPQTSKAQRVCLFGIVLHIGVLAFFKSAVFSLDHFDLATTHGALLSIILPLGLSCQKFRAITDHAAVHRDELNGKNSYLDD